MCKIEIGKVIAGRYKILKKLGEGAFGEIYLGTDQTNKYIAIKIQSHETIKNLKPQLTTEAAILNSLALENKICIGIPEVYYAKTENEQSQEKYTVMVMQLLGPSLEDLLILCDKKFSLKTTTMVGIQMIELIKFVHSKGILHRDIKPDNFLIGCGQKVHKIFIIDFGLAKKYQTKDKGHVQYKDGKNLTGTARYCSINTHIGIQQSRRDDIESFAYVLLYFMKGYLPWQNLKASNKKEKYQRILEKKLNTPINILCQGCPKQIEDILTHARNLHFEKEPDYDMIGSKLRSILEKQNAKMDFNYDWLDAAKKKRKIREMQIEPKIKYQ